MSLSLTLKPCLNSHGRITRWEGKRLQGCVFSPPLQKTQPFNWIDSRLFTVHRCAPSLPHRLRDLRLRRGIHVQRTPGGQNWFAKSDQVVLMWKNNLRGRSRKSRGVRACVSARHAAFPQGRKEGGQQVPWVHACTLRLMVCTHLRAA